MSDLVALFMLIISTLFSVDVTESVVETMRASTTVPVLEVIDGDTIVVEYDGRAELIRYIGIEAPEVGRDGESSECFAEAATTANSELVAERNVTLVRDQSNTDRYNRLLRYVYVDGELVQETLVRGGFATALTIPPDTRHAKQFQTIEQDARAAKRGLWAKCR